MKKHNCHTCKNKGSVAGSSHSNCTFFNQEQAIYISMLSLQSLEPLGRLINNKTKEDLGPVIKLNKTGVEGGWCIFPINFDPRWIEECKLYEEKDEDKQV